MNAEVMHNFEQALNVPDLKDIKTNVEPIGAILKRIDDTDLLKAKEHYSTMLDLHTQEIVSRMRHRAAMLRERAEQLDKEADHFLRQSENIAIYNTSLMDHVTEIEGILHALAHIEPQRV